MEEKTTQHEKTEKTILLISFTAGLLMAIAELIFAVYSHSQSSLMDAVYDGVELIFIALILFLTPLFHKPISEKRPYGFFQIESIFLLIKGFMMLSVTLSVSMGIIESALNGGNPVDTGSVSLFQLILGMISVVIYFIMCHLNHELTSPTVDAELMGWRLDIFYSLGMALAFFASGYLDHGPLAFLSPYFDPVVAVLIVVFMLPENVELLRDSIRDLFLFSPDEETVQSIKDACETILDKYNFKSLFYDVTRTGRHLWVSVYFTVPEDNKLFLSKLRYASDEVDAKISAEFENCTCELILRPDEVPLPEVVEVV